VRVSGFQQKELARLFHLYRVIENSTYLSIVVVRETE